MYRRIEKHINPPNWMDNWKRLQRVKFRKFPEGDVQHGACSKNLRLRRATPPEYQDLLDELVKIGYTDLEVVK
jgi:hypothetical protein